MTIKKEYTKEERISKEVSRLKRIFKEVNKDKLNSLEGLIQRAGFLRITLEDMEIELLENGFVELFTQSPTTPPYERERPVAKQYSTVIKNYQTICKQLSDMVDNKINLNVVTDGFEEFIGNK